MGKDEGDNPFDPIPSTSGKTKLPKTEPIIVDAVNRVDGIATIKAPPFNDSDPELWFRQVEFQFELNKYRSERTKFVHVASILPPTAASHARHIILKPDIEDGDYNRLRDTIIKALGQSADEKLINLLDREEIGMKKPSVFYRRLRQLAPPEVASDELIKKRWLSKLPSQTRSMANAFNELTDDLERLLDMTDRMHISTPQISAVDTSRRQHYRNRSHSRSRQNRSPSAPRRNNGNRQDGLCYYHRRFGQRAHRCQSPTTCTFNRNNLNANTQA